MRLIIGNKNYSSWSLRAWAFLHAFGVPFEEQRIALNQPDTRSRIRDISPAGKVPVLLDVDIVVWDSLAICEYVSEHYLAGQGWPTSRALNAKARSAVCEMHSGFTALRHHMPMNCRATGRVVATTPELADDIQRIDDLWCGLRSHSASQGPWLCGEFGIVDCFYSPVAFRCRTYGVKLSPTASAYQEALLQHPSLLSWLRSAQLETEVIQAEEIG